MGCSNLNSHLVDRYLSENRECACGYANENTKHFLLHCPKFNEARDHIRKIDTASQNDVTTLLYGNPEFSVDKNREIFTHVQNFIIKSQRFGTFTN